MVQKEKIVEFFKRYKLWFIIGLVVIFIAGLIPLFIKNNPFLKNNEKAAKILIDSLHKDNALLIKQLEINKDSVRILHEAAIASVLRDTIYLNQIKWLTTKTNEEIIHFNTLTRDSQYLVFTSEAELFLNSK